jgi:hypothetical protein
VLPLPVLPLPVLQLPLPVLPLPLLVLPLRLRLLWGRSCRLQRPVCAQPSRRP